MKKNNLILSISFFVLCFFSSLSLKSQITFENFTDDCYILITVYEGQCLPSCSSTVWLAPGGGFDMAAVCAEGYPYITYATASGPSLNLVNLPIGLSHNPFYTPVCGTDSGGVTCNGAGLSVSWSNTTPGTPLYVAFQ